MIIISIVKSKELFCLYFTIFHCLSRISSYFTKLLRALCCSLATVKLCNTLKNLHVIFLMYNVILFCYDPLEYFSWHSWIMGMQAVFFFNHRIWISNIIKEKIHKFWFSNPSVLSLENLIILSTLTLPHTKNFILNSYFLMETKLLSPKFSTNILYNQFYCKLLTLVYLQSATSAITKQFSLLETLRT